MMGFIERELDVLRGMLSGAAFESPEYMAILAAQQALSWALEPQGFMPFSGYLMGIAAGSTNYPTVCHPVLSSNISCHCGTPPQPKQRIDQC